MAIYHFHDSVISRGKGQSVVAAAAYQSRAALYNERDGETKDYSDKVGQDLLFSGVYVPKDAPDWSRNAEQLWNEVERAEDRHNKTRKASATLAHNIDLALMAELTAEQNRYALQDFVRETYVRAGHGVQVSIHGHEAGGDKRNIHAHLLVSLRTLDGEGFRAQKERTDRRQMQKQICEWREAWAHTAARHLRRHGHEQAAARMEIGHLDLETQRQKALERGDIEHAEALAREPTRHLGAKATRRERNGYQTERGDLNREIREQAKNSQTRNRWNEKTERELEELEAERRRKAEEARKSAEEEAKRQEDARQQAEEQEAARAFEEMMQEIREEEQARKEERERTQSQQPPAEEWNKLRVPSRIERPASIEATQAPTAELWKADRLHRARQEPEAGQPPPIPRPSNENRPQTPPQAPQRPAEPSPRSQPARAFEQAQQGERPTQPEPPRRRTEQREAFNEAARPPEEPEKAQESRRQDDGGNDSQTQTHAPQIVNRRRPRAQTAEEMRERQKNRSGRKRTREPDRD